PLFEPHPMAISDELTLDRGKIFQGHVRVIHQSHGARADIFAPIDEVDNAFKPNREPDSRNVLSKKPSDHAVISPAAANRAARLGVGHLENRPGVIPHSPYERGVE